MTLTNKNFTISRWNYWTKDKLMWLCRERERERVLGGIIMKKQERKMFMCNSIASDLRKEAVLKTIEKMCAASSRLLTNHLRKWWRMLREWIFRQTSVFLLEHCLFRKMSKHSMVYDELLLLVCRWMEHLKWVVIMVSISLDLLSTNSIWIISMKQIFFVQFRFIYSNCLFKQDWPNPREYPFRFRVYSK